MLWLVLMFGGLIAWELLIGEEWGDGDAEGVGDGADELGFGGGDDAVVGGGEGGGEEDGAFEFGGGGVEFAERGAEVVEGALVLGEEGGDWGGVGRRQRGVGEGDGLLGLGFCRCVGAGDDGEEGGDFGGEFVEGVVLGGGAFGGALALLEVAGEDADGDPFEEGDGGVHVDERGDVVAEGLVLLVGEVGEGREGHVKQGEAEFGFEGGRGGGEFLSELGDGGVGVL